MTVSSIDAGKTICELSRWKTSNLRLQKLLYIAQVYHIGEHGKYLIDEDFVAWKLGPVEPKLYYYCKMCGSDYIDNIFPKNAGVDEEINAEEFNTLKMAFEKLKKLSNNALVRATHWEKGAWHYVYERNTRGVAIPRELLEMEYNNRLGKEMALEEHGK